MTHYDIIGDIHGHADELCQLFDKLGYQRSGYGYRHNERKVIFVGDFIDRGPAIAEAVQIARATVDDGYGYAVMGNHEFNAIAFHTRRPDSREFFRPRSDKNQRQHQSTLDQLSRLEMREAINWFKTLPVAIEIDGLRVVHAAWQPKDIQVIESAFDNQGRFTTDFLESACEAGDRLYQAIENVLKGPEMQLPGDKSFLDKDGHERFKTRIRWWANPVGMTIQSYSIGAGNGLPNDPVPDMSGSGIVEYSASERPVFFGHYWLQVDPGPFAPNVTCVDYSVAKRGNLCAYQWNAGDTTLNPSQFIWVDADHS